MVKKNVKNKTLDKNENLEELVDLELVTTTMKFKRDKLRQLRIESAEKGTSMANIMRGLLDNHLESDDDEARYRVEDHLDDILHSCEGWVGGFKIDKFVEQMSDKDISLSDLNRVEWRSVLDKLEEGGLNGVVNAGEYRDKFSDLNPSHSQRRDLRQLARKLIKNKKNSLFG